MIALSGEAMSRDRRCQKPPTDPRMPERRNLRDPDSISVDTTALRMDPGLVSLSVSVPCRPAHVNVLSMFYQYV